MATTPLTKWLYPPWYQTKMEKWRRGETDKDGNPTPGYHGEESLEKLSSPQVHRLLVYLRLDSLPSLFTFIALLGPDKEARVVNTTEEYSATEKGGDKVTTQPITRRPLEVHGLRILELTERTSSVMQVTEGEEYYSERDPVVNAFRTFSQLNGVAASGKVSIVPEPSYAEALRKEASDASSDFVLIPWSEHGSVTEDTSAPFPAASAQDRRGGRGAHLDFVNKALEGPACDTGVLISHGPGGAGPAGSGRPHRVYVPFFGGADDRAALRLAMQLANNPHVALSVVHFSWAAHDDDGGSGDEEVDAPPRAHLAAPGSSTDDGGGDTEAPRRKAAEGASAQDLALLSTLRPSAPRRPPGLMSFLELSVTRGTAVAEAVAGAAGSPRGPGDVVVVGRAHPGLGDAQVGRGGDRRGTVGVVADRLLGGGVGGTMLVVKAGGAGLQW